MAEMSSQTILTPNVPEEDWEQLYEKMENGENVIVLNTQSKENCNLNMQVISKKDNQTSALKSIVKQTHVLKSKKNQKKLFVTPKKRSVFDDDYSSDDEKDNSYDEQKDLNNFFDELYQYRQEEANDRDCTDFDDFYETLLGDKQYFREQTDVHLYYDQSSIMYEENDKCSRTYNVANRIVTEIEITYKNILNLLNTFKICSEKNNSLAKLSNCYDMRRYIVDFIKIDIELLIKLVQTLANVNHPECNACQKYISEFIEQNPDIIYIIKVNFDVIKNSQFMTAENISTLERLCR